MGEPVRKVKRILIWGTGNYLERYKSHLNRINKTGRYELMGFIDSNQEKQGRILHSRKIYSPDQVRGMSPDLVVVAVSKQYLSEIEQYLMTEAGIKKESICTYTWFLTAQNDTDEICETKLSRVFDCFPFFNELDILELRFELLDNMVDYFVLVELDKTHRWEDKPLYFRDNINRFEKFLDRIIYVCPTDGPKKPDNAYLNWTLENFQRNCIARGLEGMAENDDIVMISDVDEIPKPATIREALKNTNKFDYNVYSLSQNFFYYFFDFCHKEKWRGTAIMKYRNLGTPQFWRNMRNELPEILNGGWHLSYFGGVGSIQCKAASTVDSAEFSLTEKDIKNRLINGKDIFNREGDRFDLERVDISALDIPNIDKVMEKYPQFFMGKDGV